MRPPRRRRLSVLVVLLAGLSIAPAPPRPPDGEPTAVANLAKARYEAALAQYDLEWTYFQQNRTGSLHVYVWSRLVLEARRDMGENQAERIAALKAHLARMQKLEDLVKRIRRLGFGLSADVGATRFYRVEAEYWLARAAEEGR